MCKEQQLTSLGFTEGQVPVGTHMCLIFTDEEERRDSLLKFLLSGIKLNERTACFTSKISEQEVRDFFKENSISYDERKGANALSLHDTGNVYFEGGTFDPERLLCNLTEFYNESKQLHFCASRIIGEMDPKVETIPGGDRLLEYESRVSIMLRDHPITVVCQYDANLFDGATVMDVLKVHPQMIINGSIVQNPFYIEPEEYLSSIV